MSARNCTLAFAVFFFVAPVSARAQSTTYRLHAETSTTSGFRQLKAVAPDVAATVLQSANLQSTAAGEKVVAQFDTASGVPGVAGKIPSGATITAQVWMRKTASFGVMTPRVKVRLNNSSGTALCTATGTTALTTTLTSYALSCTTTAHVTLTATSRLYVWAGVNLTTTSSAGAFRGELGLEGSIGGNYESFVTTPNALAVPSIASLSPATGSVGQSVTISGANFHSAQLGSVVRFFNNKTAAVTSWSNTSIVAAVPAGTTTGAVTVTVAGTASNGSTFTILPPPSISSVAPAAGPPGTVVTVTGTNFGASQGASTVRFNGTTASVTSWSNTQVVAPVPATATSGNVVVTVNGVATNGVAFTVAAAPPVLTPAGGTYAAGQTVAISSATPGATIYYTTNGADPTPADSPLSNGGIVPVGNYTIKARAYANGLAASGVTQAAYQRDSAACTYAIRPGALSLGGAASAGQVAVYASNEFCDWTAASTQGWLTLGVNGGTGSTSIPWVASTNSTAALRNASIGVGGSSVAVVQNVVASCSFAIAPSAVATGAAAGGGSISVFANDPACAWVAASDTPWLTLNVVSGVGDGSLTYSHLANPGPDARWSGPTIANQQGSVSQASGTALSIAGGTTPPANALGWHRDDVTVTFQCAGPGNIVCAPPQLVTADGVQDVTVDASNDLSQTASATVTVRIDRVAPHVAVSFPRANSFVQVGAVTIRGTVTDALSAPTVTCGEALASVSGASFACTVVVASGTTTIPIAATDAAGNQRAIVATLSTTDAIVIEPTILRVSPQNVAMAVGERRRFAMLDDLDRSPVDVSWTRTNPSLSSVTITDGQLELTGVATGTTTLTASWRGLSATATVTIVSANSFVAGTTIWTAPPLTPGATVADVVKGAATPDGDAYLYAIERGETDRIRMLTADGIERVTFATGGQVTQLSGDQFGGAVALIGSSLYQIGVNGGMFAIASDVGAPGFSIHPNGALYFSRVSETEVTRLASIDIGLGQGRSIDLPGVQTLGMPTVMPDGSVALPYIDDGFRLLIARPNGVDSLYYVIDPQYPVTSFRQPYKAIPDGTGGYFVAYDENSVYTYNAMLARVDSSGTPPQTVAIIGGGQHGINSGSWHSYGGGTSNGTLQFGPVTAGGSDVLVATINKFQNGQGGVAVTDVSMSGYVISTFWSQSNVQPTYLASEEGFVGSSPIWGTWGPSPDYELLALANPRPASGGRWIGAQSGSLAEVAGPVFSSAISSWGSSGGDLEQGNAARSVRYVHSHPLLSLGTDQYGVPAASDWFKWELENVYRIPGSHRVLVGPQATHIRFVNDVARPAIDVVSFLGHAVPNPEGFGALGGSPGLYFHDKWALLKEGYTPTGTPAGRLYHVNTISSTFKIMFLGTCDLGSIFQSVWPLNGRQAIIHPIFPGPNNSSKLVVLGAAATAFQKMMQELALPSRTVADAVAVGNAYINERFATNSIDYFQFAVYGNPSVKIQP